jgi:hypothetical protein
MEVNDVRKTCVALFLTVLAAVVALGQEALGQEQSNWTCMSPE